MEQLNTTTTSKPALYVEVGGAIAERVRGEFREMPGLTLTLAQAGRLWNLDSRTCSEILAQLVSAGFLCRRTDGAFCRTVG